MSNPSTTGEAVSGTPAKDGRPKIQDKINILMVDDQPGKLLTYEAILSELGENLIKANSGREALEHLSENRHRRRADGRKHAGTRRIRIGGHDSPASPLSGDCDHFYFRGALDRYRQNEGL